MGNTINWRDEGALSPYPFASDGTLSSTTGGWTLPDSIFVDAVVMVRGDGPVFLSKLWGGSGVAGEISMGTGGRLLLLIHRPRSLYRDP